MSALDPDLCVHALANQPFGLQGVVLFGLQGADPGPDQCLNSGACPRRGTAQHHDITVLAVVVLVATVMMHGMILITFTLMILLL